MNNPEPPEPPSTDPRWKRLSALFSEALKCPHEERETFLREATAGR